MRRRGRGQHHRKPGQQQHHHHHQGRNQTFDSNGPGVRLRGTAHQIYEKYLTLGRDSSASGDRIVSESYFQHADHYYRHILASQGPLEEFRERGEGQEGDLEAEGSAFGQGEQPSEGQPPQSAYGSTVPQTQALNGGGPSQGSSLPGGNQPRSEGQRESRGDDRRNDDRGDGQQGGQGQHHGGFRRDRFNRRFRNRDDRPFQEQGDRGDRSAERNDRGGERREGRDGNREDRPREDRPREDRGRDRDHRPQRREDDAFEPPAFLKAERPAGDAPPRDPFNRDEE
jgi:hypothetical protein